MTFANGSGGRMVEMNITPLVDVMLVLLIIFMVAMPPRTYPIGVDLPTRSPTVVPTPAKPIALKISANGNIDWNGSAVPMNALFGAMKIEAERYADPALQPMIEIDADQDAQYQVLASVLADAKNAGLAKVGFVDKNQR
jgi:biopolymer transport protein ExbD